MTLTPPRRWRPLAAALAVCASGLAIGAGPALAAGPVSLPTPPTAVPNPAPGCAVGATSQAFSHWGDANQYTLVPGGNFAGAAPGWTLSGGARVISAQVPYDLGGGTVGALYLPIGASAQSPAICVDPGDPTYRFLGASAGLLSGLTSTAVYASPAGVPLPLAGAVLPLSMSWGPTPSLWTAAQPASAVSGGTARMALRFTAVTGPALIDDVFVDPRMHK